ncbi:glycosyltransferase family 2 protein [Microbacterium rhizosphaerae]|uniref:Glycosyltransferase family A protein n=1 Tax=Microbacterium rhizosphaerae TaxID=1678237 RepID=A0ABZ0SN58_9MICO|nr:glycosyltransferase family A protein [Microbacterium rhizosphaerae]WPR90807.1 glycosyltransferase family A protein [Microbacterium rhizosphaerae]
MTASQATPRAREAPVVSVVVRTKDRPMMLQRALRGILGQSFVDLEVIVVNDGGDPATIAGVIAGFSESDQARVVRIDHERSLGRWPTANDGVLAARGRFVALHDDDDLWHVDFLERTVAFLDATPDAAAVAVPTEVVYEELEDGQWVERSSYLWSPPGNVVTLFDLILHNRVVPISMLTRRSTYDEIGLYDPTLDVVGDWEFNLRLAARGTIAYLDGPVLAYWRQRPAMTGPLGNSVHAEQTAHFKFDRLVRERALKSENATADVAQLLYLSKIIDERFGDAERRIIERLDALEQAMQRSSAALDSQIKRQSRYFSLGQTVVRLRRRLWPPRSGRRPSQAS